MATTRGKAQTFVKELATAQAEIAKRLSIDAADIKVTARVTVHDVVIYASDEDDK